MYTKLAIDIIKKAVIDLKNEKANESDKNSAKLFFKGDWFEVLCMCLEVDKNIILDKIRNYL